jgi:hypothetical protein
MKYFHKSIGKIIYDPFRANKFQPHWCIVEVDKEITRYYRDWLRREQHLILEEPSWNAHVSVVRGEGKQITQPTSWKQYHNTKIQFCYEHGRIISKIDPKQPGKFYWIEVECPLLVKIRKDLGLPVGWKMHITIGRTYY